MVRCLLKIGVPIQKRLTNKSTSEIKPVTGFLRRPAVAGSEGLNLGTGVGFRELQFYKHSSPDKRSI